MTTRATMITRINTHDALPIGSRVAYSDMANPYQTAIVTELPHSSRGGLQRCVFEDGHGSTVCRSLCTSPGGWRLLDGLADQAEIEDARRREAARLDEQRQDQEAYFDRMRTIEAAVDAAQPEGAKAAIVATLVANDCDLVTDYFATSDQRTVLLAWSTHERRLFGEMRKAARGSAIPKVQALSEKNPDQEHREDYSMGHGLYLKDGDRYDSGWEISKVSLRSLRTDSTLDLSSL